MKFCRECGCENLDEAQFCKNCGLEFKSLPVNENKPDNEVKVRVNKNQDSIISKLFYKTDKYTGELRFAKSKSISILVFVAMFLLAMFVNLGQFPLISVFLAAIIVGLVFAIPTFLIGYALGWAIDRLNN
ncbi:zinc-ribbon domain-containing protein [Methanobrevibacter sp.]|uniref:zinc-ribbon domain-containing protein n=1 Tax=Methanobrevibacter sp. TaxID=66852 RepID=UPI0038637341